MAMGIKDTSLTTKSPPGVDEQGNIKSQFHWTASHEQRAVFEAGLRWASNILNELANNYSKYMTDEARQLLKVATIALGDLASELRE